MLNIKFVQSKFSKIKNKGIQPKFQVCNSKKVDATIGRYSFLNVWFIFFQSEVTKLQEQIDTEVRVRKDLDEKVAKMNQLLTTGQD